MWCDIASVVVLVTLGLSFGLAQNDLGLSAPRDHFGTPLVLASLKWSCLSLHGYCSPASWHVQWKKKKKKNEEERQKEKE